MDGGGRRVSRGAWTAKVGLGVGVVKLRLICYLVKALVQETTSQQRRDMCDLLQNGQMLVRGRGWKRRMSTGKGNDGKERKRHRAKRAKGFDRCKSRCGSQSVTPS